MTKRQFLVSMVVFGVFFVGMEIKIALIQHETIQHLDHANATLGEMNQDLVEMNKDLTELNASFNLDGGGP